MSKSLKIALILLAWLGFVLFFAPMTEISRWVRYPIVFGVSWLVGWLIVRVYYAR